MALVDDRTRVPFFSSPSFHKPVSASKVSNVGSLAEGASVKVAEMLGFTGAAVAVAVGEGGFAVGVPIRSGVDVDVDVAKGVGEEGIEVELPATIGVDVASELTWISGVMEGVVYRIDDVDVTSGTIEIKVATGDLVAFLNCQ
ncbi:MAG: hypothetical protein KDI62_24990 [Anaerolineae bacterium]|nr:hypothetical protein [Anaerolineae bacterium]MCB9107944.1 hypothetical protein [Anaerolineales bacterium]